MKRIVYISETRSFALPTATMGKMLNTGLKGKSGFGKTMGQLGNFATMASGNKKLNETLFGTKRKWYDPRKYTTDKLGWSGQKGLVNQALGKQGGQMVEAAMGVGSIANSFGNSKGSTILDRFNQRDNSKQGALRFAQKSTGAFNKPVTSTPTATPTQSSITARRPVMG